MCTSQDPTVNPSSISFLPTQTEGRRVVQGRERRRMWERLQSPRRASKWYASPRHFYFFSHLLLSSLVVSCFALFASSWSPSPPTHRSTPTLCFTYVLTCNCFIMRLFILQLCSLTTDTQTKKERKGNSHAHILWMIDANTPTTLL